MNRGNKYFLFERLQRLNPTHRFQLNEADDKLQYKSIITEEENSSFSSLTEAFMTYNKLSGLVEQDKKYIKGFINLMENVDDFDPFAHLKNTQKIDEKEDCVLTFSPYNDKLDHPYFSLPAGYTCPFAEICKTLVPRDREKIHGKLVQDIGGDMRCYAASEEARYPSAQENRWRNKDLLDKFDLNGKVDLILRSLAFFEQKHSKITVFRIHESGDFYSLEYFDAWLEVARRRPDILFYAYTKSLPFWVRRKKVIPQNMKLVASVGGKKDELITKNDLKYAVVVNTPEEAKNLHLPIDIDDTMAYKHDGNFALLIHGAQIAGTDKSKASFKNRKIIKQIKKGEYPEV